MLTSPHRRTQHGIMIVLLTGGFLSLLNETILNVALTDIMRDMRVTTTVVQWLSTGYVLVVAVMVPISAFLIRTFTTKQLHLGAMALFLAGTVVAFLAPSFPTLLAGRMLQAVGTGLLAPIMINTALSIYPRERQGFVMGICTCVILVGPSVGPIVSGVVLQFVDWRALFALLLPLIIVCMAGGATLLGTAIPLTKPHIDLWSIVLSTVGFAALVYAMSIVNSSEWWLAALLFAVGALAIGGFCKRQLSLPQPMLNVRVFAKPSFAVGALLVVAIQMVQFSMNIVLPLLFENGLGLSSLQAALLLLPAVVICSVMTVIAGRLFDRIGGKTLIPLGLLVMLVFLIALIWQRPSTPVVVIMLLNVGIYFGISLTWSPNQSNALAELSPKDQTDGVSIINTLIQLGSALGTPLFVGVMSAGESSYLSSHLSKTSLVHTSELTTAAFYAGFSRAMLVGSILIALTLLASMVPRLSSHLRDSTSVS